jgi:hypothetical protein
MPKIGHTKKYSTINVVTRDRFDDFNRRCEAQFKLLALEPTKGQPVPFFGTRSLDKRTRRV